MNKHSRKIRKSEKVESPVTEEQVAPIETSADEGLIVREQEPTDHTDEGYLVERDDPHLVPEPVSAAETSQDVPQPEEEPSADTGTEEEVGASPEAPEDVGGESQTEKVGRKSAIKDDSLIKVLMTENFQRKGTYSFQYNEDLIENGDCTAGKAMNELGVPRHHLLYLSKEGKVEIVNG